MRKVRAHMTRIDEMISVLNDLSVFTMKEMTKQIDANRMTKNKVKTMKTSKLLLIFVFIST